MSHDPKKLAEMDQKHLLHPASSITQVMESGPTIMTSGKGVRVTDANGHELLDGVAGLWCVNVGYGREELGEVMKEAASEMGYYHSFTGMSNPHQIKLAEKLALEDRKSEASSLYRNALLRNPDDRDLLESK